MVFSWAIFDKYRLISLTDANLKESISKRDVLVFGLTGILSWGIGAVIFFSSIELIGASRATPISSINPIIAVILGVVFLKEKFSSLQGLGILLVCLGSIAISIL
jgi:DME family drug/metabolite transporter